MLRLSQAGDYAIRGMMCLASRPQGEVVLVREVARECNIPHAFLAKIFQMLAHAAVLRSHLGHGGGFSLARSPEQINVLEAVEAIEGKIILYSPKETRTLDEQVVEKLWCQVQDHLLLMLEQISIADLVDQSEQLRGS